MLRFSGFIFSLFFSLIVFSQNIVNEKIEISAHRGANKLAPENTLAAGKASVENGVTYIEMDIRTSKDGILYILHDPVLNRTTNGKGFFKNKKSEELNQLDAGSWFSADFKREPIPILKDYLLWAKGKSKIYLDVKKADLDQLVSLVRETEMQNDCFFWIRSKKKSLYLKSIAPEMHLKMNAKNIKKAEEAKNKYKASIIECNYKHLNGDFVKVCKENNLKIMLWGLPQNEEGFKKALLHPAIDIVNIDDVVLFNKVKADLLKGNL
jgi:hypothetical protein